MAVFRGNAMTHHWRTIAEITEPNGDTALPSVARIEISGAVMRYTILLTMGPLTKPIHKYAPLRGWNGKWMTLAEAERIADRGMR